MSPRRTPPDQPAAADAPALTRGQRTRHRLLEEALRLFALKGQEAVGIREVAAAAGTNIASIAFHFGDKQGLYIAVIERMAGELAGLHRAALAEAEAASAAASEAAGEDPGQRVRRIMAALVARLLTSHRSQWMSLLLQREFIAPTAAFEHIYATALEPTLTVLARLAAVGRPADAAPDAKVLAYTLFIMASAFARNKTTFLRFAGGTDYAPEDVARISRVVADFAARGLSDTL